MIIYLKHHQIDKNRWDEVIRTSSNGLVYALSWYLDTVSPGWEALIEDDYEYLMPLPVKKKIGVPYLVQPLFTQQLGIFSAHPVSPGKVRDFLNRIPAKFIRCHINLNDANPITPLKSLNQGVNYILPLNSCYQELWRGFDENTRRNIKKAGTAKITIARGSCEIFIENFCQNLRNPLPDSVFAILRNIMDNKIGEIYLVVNEREECIAGAFFINTLGRLIYLVSFSTHEGKEKSAMFFLMEYVLRKFSGSNRVLDFEGSSIPGVARFFKGLGATKILFPELRKGII
jgi:hypothetical protein